MMKSWKKEMIVELLIELEKIALYYYERSNKLAYSIKPDKSIVTIADTEIERRFLQAFDHPDKQCFLLGEETSATKSQAYLDKALEQTLYIVDPIDGTSSYLNHIPTWGISLGYAKQSILEEGAIYLPLTGELFISEGETVYFLNIKEATDSLEPIAYRRFDSQPTNIDSSSLLAVTQDMLYLRHLDLLPSVQLPCSAVTAFAYLLQGCYVAYIANIKLWDLAGAFPLLSKLGFEGRKIFSKQLLHPRIDTTGFYLKDKEEKGWLLREPCIFSRRTVANELLETIHFDSSDKFLREKK